MVQQCSSLLPVTQHSYVSSPAHICIYITPTLALVCSHCYKPCGQLLTSFFYAGGRFGSWSQPDLLDKRVTLLSVAWL